MNTDSLQLRGRHPNELQVLDKGIVCVCEVVEASRD